MDFSHLVDLADIDRYAREALLPMTLDCEHFTKVALASSYASQACEHNYDIVEAFVATLDAKRRRAVTAKLETVLEKDQDGVHRFQTLLDSIMFGTLTSLVRFCGERWEDRHILSLHYALRTVLTLRNCTAHAGRVIPEFARDNVAAFAVDYVLARVVSRCSLSKRRRKAQLDNLGVRRIVTLMYLHATLIPEGHSKRRAWKKLSDFYERSRRNQTWYEEGHALISGMDFLEALTPTLLEVE